MHHRFTVILIILSLLSTTAAQAAGHCSMMSAGMSAGMTDGTSDTLLPSTDNTSDTATNDVIIKVAGMSEGNDCHEMMKQANSEPETLNTPPAETTAMDCCGINMADCKCVQGCSVVMLLVALTNSIADDPYHSADSDRHTSLWINPSLAALYRPPIAAA